MISRQIAAALTRARATDRPSMIACKTMIGYGAPGKQGKESAHGSPLGADQIAAAREKLGWPHAPFEIPEPILGGWREAGARGAAAREAWKQRLANSPQRAAFERFMLGDVAADIAAPLKAFREQLAPETPNVATRKSSEMALGVINAATRATIGGSADLTHSNYTITKGHRLGGRPGLFRPLHPLRRARIRHGRGDERHRAARRFGRPMAAPSWFSPITRARPSGWPR